MTKISELFCIIQPIHKRLFSLSIPPSNEKGKTHKRAGDSLSYIGTMTCAVTLWELPKDWNLPLPYHKVVAINSLNLPYLTIGLGC